MTFNDNLILRSWISNMMYLPNGWVQYIQTWLPFSIFLENYVKQSLHLCKSLFRKKPKHWKLMQFQILQKFCEQNMYYLILFCTLLHGRQIFSHIVWFLNILTWFGTNWFMVVFSAHGLTTPTFFPPGLSTPRIVHPPDCPPHKLSTGFVDVGRWWWTVWPPGSPCKAKCWFEF